MGGVKRDRREKGSEGESERERSAVESRLTAPWKKSAAVRRIPLKHLLLIPTMRAFDSGHTHTHTHTHACMHAHTHTHTHTHVRMCMLSPCHLTSSMPATIHSHTGTVFQKCPRLECDVRVCI